MIYIYSLIEWERGDWSNPKWDAIRSVIHNDYYALVSPMAWSDFYTKRFGQIELTLGDRLTDPQRREAAIRGSIEHGKSRFFARFRPRFEAQFKLIWTALRQSLEGVIDNAELSNESLASRAKMDFSFNTEGPVGFDEGGQAIIIQIPMQPIELCGQGSVHILLEQELAL